MKTIIVAVNTLGYIGLNGDIPWRCPEDLKHFKATTMGKTLVMGRKTYEGLPVKLRGRNIEVASRSGKTLEACLEEYKGKELIIAGGGEVYNQTIDIADRVILSVIKGEPVKGDTRFPMEKLEQYQLVDSTEHATFTVKIYERTKK